MPKVVISKIKNQMGMVNDIIIVNMQTLNSWINCHR